MLKRLKYFQSVVRLNSFSEAAEENYISQSAISQQIQALERELGFKLLERRNRTFDLTPAGEYFYQKSLVLTADFERMCGEAARMLVIARRGFMPVEGGSMLTGTSIARVRLMRGDEPILRSYCAFWKKTNDSPHVKEFAGLLKAQFEERTETTD